MIMDINLDVLRQQRLGFDEAIYCAGKSVSQIMRILDQGQQRGMTFLLTRLDSIQWQSLPEQQRSAVDYDALSQTGFFGAPKQLRQDARVAIVTAGSSDVPVGREAARTLHYYGEPCLEIMDVGVAGLWRLLERIEDIRAQPVIIVVAGMDAALPSVIGGLVPGCVIAVPTSVGYGVAKGGETALRAALASCAPGIVVVNIDNGYGAACAALRALHMGNRDEP